MKNLRINLLVGVAVLFVFSCQKDNSFIPEKLSQKIDKEIIIQDFHAQFVEIQKVQKQVDSLETFTSSSRYGRNDSKKKYEIDWSKAVNKDLGKGRKFTFAQFSPAAGSSSSITKKLKKHIVAFYENGEGEFEYIFFKRLNPRGKKYISLDDELTNGSLHQINFEKRIDGFHDFLDSYLDFLLSHSRTMGDCSYSLECGDPTWWQALWESIGSFIGGLGRKIGNFFANVFGNSAGSSGNDKFHASGSVSGIYTPFWYSPGSVSKLGVGVDYSERSGGGATADVRDNYGRMIYDLGIEATMAMIPFLENTRLDHIRFLAKFPSSADHCRRYLNYHDFSDNSIAVVEKYIELFNKYSNFRSSYVDLFRIANKDQFDAAATLYENYMSQVNSTPKDPYQWQLAMEVFQEELLPIFLEFTPGIGDLIGSYNDFRSGNYFWGCVGIIASIVPGDEVIKVIQKADNIRDGWKAVKAVFRLWNKLFTSTGGRKVLNKMPRSWKDLPGKKLQSDNNSLKWVLPGGGHHFRLSDKKKYPKYENDKYPYAQFFKNGSYRDLDGNPVSLQTKAAHIRIDELTDEFLEWFFN